MSYEWKWEGLFSKLLTGVMYRCGKCNEEIYYDDKYVSKRAIHIPLDPDTGKYHKCKTSVHKRKGMLRVLTRTQIECYKTLGIYPGATVTEIEDAFNEKVHFWHPDNPAHGDFNMPGFVEKKYKEVIEAHNNIRLIYVRDE